ncbi:MAG: amidohydrolase [Bacteroidota bacterium]
MSNLSVALVQTDIVWEDTANNLNNLSKKLASISEKVDLIVLPEMFTTGFTMNVDSVKEKIEGEAYNWMKKMSQKLDCAIYGSVITEDEGGIYNRGYFFFPDGSHKIYDKKHLFTLAGEDKVFTAGSTRKVIDYKGWKIMPQICYDLRFPVWSRNNLEYDLLLYIASWPKKRKFHWNSLLPARAIENMSYVVAVNRVGSDDNNLDYSGNSKAIDYSGEIVAAAKEETEEIVIVHLDKEKQSNFREQFAFLKDMDDFIITHFTG